MVSPSVRKVRICAAELDTWKDRIGLNRAILGPRPLRPQGVDCRSQTTGREWARCGPCGHCDRLRSHYYPLDYGISRIVSSISQQKAAMKPIVLVAAMDAGRAIGRGNDIPWHIPGEQKVFRELTMGNALIMGRMTYLSLPRPLPGRYCMCYLVRSLLRQPVCSRLRPLTRLFHWRRNCRVQK
ncbi:hypothetical protein EHS39_35020 [Ensifer sp. MPMI2T]|nr:hypothetical protein EHS39_35020 [Ensifer sp. MPMI2T]